MNPKSSILRITCSGIASAVLCLPASGWAKRPAQRENIRNITEYIRELEKDSLMNTTSWSVVIKDVETGKVLAERNPEASLAGASITKLLTTGAALVSLGSNFRYETELSYSGFIADSTLYGTLYVTGGGDPSLGSDYRKFLPSPDSVFSVWKQALSTAGIARIKGRMVADSRYFTPEPAVDSWMWGDLDTYYGTGTSGLSFFENKLVVAFEPSDTLGNPVRIPATYPEVPGIRFVNRSRTSTGKNNWLCLGLSPLHPLEHFVEGSLGAECGKTDMALSNRAAGASLLCEFDKYLSTGGNRNEVEYILWDAYTEGADTIPERVPVLTYRSPSLSTIVAVTNKYSDNMYAETLFRTLGKIRGQDDSRWASRRVEHAVLDAVAPGSETLNLQDGSGLSYSSFLNAKYYTDFLVGMYRTDVFDDFFASLAVPGEEGTLRHILHDCPTGKNLHVKSGSLSGARAFAGYSQNGDSLICFAIIVNRFHSVVPIAPRLSRLLELISEY